MNKPFFKKVVPYLEEGGTCSSICSQRSSKYVDVAKSLYNQRKKMKRNLRRAFVRPLIARARTHTPTSPPTHTHTMRAFIPFWHYK